MTMRNTEAMPALPGVADAWLQARRGPLERLAQRLVGDAEEARDLVQSAYADALASWPEPGQLEEAEAWLRRLVINRALSHLRRRRLWRLVAVVLRVDDEAVPAVDEDAERRAHHARLAEAVARLPPRQGVAFSLRYLERQSLDEVAEALGIGRGTVRVHLQRAVKALRESGVL
jgi:RNA polymerase sigma-70 factor (ECF subfamily)